MTVLHEDEHLLVVRKPAGTLAQPDRTGDVDVLTLGKRHLREAGEEEPFLGLVHRLDRPTSGVMVLARTSAAARDLSRQFRERTAQKQYVAVVEGSLRGIGSWSDYIVKPDRQPRIVDADHPDGKRAALDWQVLHAGSERTLLLLRLHTGRPHQIRLQAAERGHSVVGDARYGAADSWAHGIALHHAVLRVEHPARPRMETFTAPIPEAWTSVCSEDMDAALTQFFDRARPAT